MLEELSQETVAEYANEALTIQEPQGTDYTQGAKVGKTIPAKWWNWLFNAVTKRLGQSKTDAQNMLTELQNVVTNAGIELDSSDNTQLEQAIIADADKQTKAYVENKRSLFIASWGTEQKIYLNDMDTPVTFSGPIYGCFEGGPTGTVIVASVTQGLDPRYPSDALMYSLDAVHWYTMATDTPAVWLIGNYLYMTGLRGVFRVDIRVQSRIGTFEELCSVTGSYTNAYMIPFPDCIFCFLADGKLYKFSNASSTFELIDDTGLAQHNHTMSGVTRTKTPKLLPDGYYVGNVKVSPDRLTWTPIDALTSDTNYSLGSNVSCLEGNSVAIMPSTSSASYYYYINANGEGHQINIADVSADVNIFSAGEDFILAGRDSGLVFYFSLDGQNFTRFSEHYGVRVRKVNGYYYVAYGTTIYCAQTLSSELSDYKAVYSASSAFDMGVMTNSPYLFLISSINNTVSTPLGNFVAKSVIAIILKDKLVQAAPTLVWPDGTTTALIMNAIGGTVTASSGNLWIANVQDLSGTVTGGIFAYTRKGLNNVVGHTLFLR